MTKLITLPLREFALPSPRSGSIELHSGYGSSTADGQEIHLRVQKRRAASDPTYQAEVAISGLFERECYSFRVDGRMDGIFRSIPPRIEEIKSTSDIRELRYRLAGDPLEHPYSLQLLTYGYLQWRQLRQLPALSFHLVSTRSGDNSDLEIPLDLPRYEQWLELRLDELVVEARQAERRAARRRSVASSFAFPFPQPRPGQIELMATIEKFMGEKRPMLIQAPTGLGKTVGVLYPVLKEALSRGERVVYVTPKNSQHSVAEDALSRFQEAGARLKSLSITAKSKICFKDEPLCTPEQCEYARNYYGKVQEGGILGLLAKKRRLKARTFRDLGEKYRLCPFELQIDAAREVDVIICDYNYVFAPRSSLARMSGMAVDQSGKPNLVIDEAHNLPARAMEYYSPALSSEPLEKMRDEIRALQGRFCSEAEELLDDCLGTLSACGKSGFTQPRRIDPPVELFINQHSRLSLFLSRYLDSAPELLPQDVILRLCYAWGEFTESLECAAGPDRREFFTTFHPHPTGGVVKITCSDASAELKECYKEYEQVAGFSATLKPFDYYIRLSGLNSAKVSTAEFTTPFPKERRKLLIIPQISTLYRNRERNYGKIAEAVQRITALRRGNYFVFFPSFDFLERVALLFDPPAGFTLARQERGINAAGVEAIVENLRSGSEPTIVFAVQGGSLSEGMDYAGEMVIGAFVVGPPLPTYNLEREQMRGYYQEKYAAGFEYAYTIPAMAKAIQAAGRVIRSETDRGVVVLMDRRFLEPAFSRSMPSDWFVSDATELVSGSILSEVADFWAE